MSSDVSKGTAGEKRRRESAPSSSSRGGSSNNASSSSSSGSSGSRFNKQDSQFLCVPRFQNNLPNAPSGPFFKDFGMVESFNQLKKYRVSSLERSYVWQPHFGVDVGMKLDLVDKDAILIPDNATKVELDPLEARYLTSSGTSDRRKGRGAEISQETINGLTWVRKTTYMPAGVSFGKHDEDKDKNKRKERELPSGAAFDPFSERCIKDSFANVEKTVKKLVDERKKKDGLLANARNLLWSIPIVPELLLSGANSNLSFVRFDEIPIMKSNGGKANGGNGNGDGDGSSKKAKGVLHSLLTNIRPHPRKKESKNVFAVSLVTSLNSNSSNGSNGSDKTAGNGDGGEAAVSSSSTTTTTTGLESESASASALEASEQTPVCYEWMADFDMTIMKNEGIDNNQFVIGIDVEKGIASYNSIPVRIEMRKAKPEDSDPTDATVFRRSSDPPREVDGDADDDGEYEEYRGEGRSASEKANGDREDKDDLDDDVMDVSGDDGKEGNGGDGNNATGQNEVPQGDIDFGDDDDDDE